MGELSSTINQRLSEAYESLRAALSGAEGLAGPLLALEAGIAHEREWVRYWRRLAEGQ